ncbi:MAG: zf-HC2 domain-containing protein [candidate division KSB1 bacterium]|nr:zf-HC2 domain-containing protein [candidate division KSB1 bacterium]MDZ7364392.1 zf-HC2 domain-containing protein [candidate division KSB1 bacterium]MDZ7402764.1 zf-HC2 domain-containing protein [candidate division KSB1 bacterium]
MSSPCKQVQEQIAGYVDRELAPSQVHMVSRHLQDCAGCAEEADAQQKMKDLVRDNAKSIPTPARVRAEIRRRLDQQNFGFGFWEQIRQLFLLQPAPAIATVLVLMLLSGLTASFVLSTQSQRASSYGQFVAGSIEGEIICVDCDLLEIVKTPYIHDATHRVGVRCPDGHVWSLLRSEKSQVLSANMHRRVRIVGRLFKQMQYIEVEEFSLI